MLNDNTELPDPERPRWKRILLSGWVSLIGCMGGAVAIEYFTRPWKSTVISTPYTMFYGLGTFVCAQHGYWWGITASMGWFAVTTLVGHYYWHVKPEPTTIEYVIRGSLHLGIPILLSRPMEKLRKILLVISTAVNHELNNMLQVVMGLSMLRDSVPVDQRYHIDETIKAAERMSRVVKRMRHYAALGRVSPEMIDISKMAEHIKAKNGNGESNGKILNI